MIPFVNNGVPHCSALAAMQRSREEIMMGGGLLRCCFANRNLLYGGISIAGIALAASQGMAQDNAPAAGRSKPSVTLPSIEITTTKKAPKRKSVARPKRTPPPAAPPEPTPAEIAAQQEAAFEEAWRRIGNPTPTKALGNLPPEYAGGQVAIGGGLGLLGNRSYMETPFSQTSYTSKTIQDQQARTVGDVLANDPSVRSVLGASAGYGFDVFNIRGFYYENGDSALNGLYGLAPQYSTAPNFVERVEVLKGPSALLNGMPPAGAIGGASTSSPSRPLTFQSRRLPRATFRTGTWERT